MALFEILRAEHGSLSRFHAFRSFIMEQSFQKCDCKVYGLVSHISMLTMIEAHALSGESLFVAFKWE